MTVGSLTPGPRLVDPLGLLRSGYDRKLLVLHPVNATTHQILPAGAGRNPLSAPTASQTNSASTRI